MDKDLTGKIIKNARIKKGYTQDELGNKINVTNKAISRWEKGYSFPDVALLEKLSEALDVSIQDLVTGELHEKMDPQVKTVLSEVVKYAEVQQKERKFFCFNLINSLIVLVFMFAGLLTLFYRKPIFYPHIYFYEIVYIVFILIYLLGWLKQLKSSLTYTNGTSRNRVVRALIPYLYCIGITAMIYIRDEKGLPLLGFAPEYIGSFLNHQYICVFIISLSLLGYGLYKSIRYSEITFGIEKTILVSTIFLSFVFNEATLMVYASLNEAHKPIIYSAITSFIFILVSIFFEKVRTKLHKRVY